MANSILFFFTDQGKEQVEKDVENCQNSQQRCLVTENIDKRISEIGNSVLSPAPKIRCQSVILPPSKAKEKEGKRMDRISTDDSSFEDKQTSELPLPIPQSSKSQVSTLPLVKSSSKNQSTPPPYRPWLIEKPVSSNQKPIISVVKSYQIPKLTSWPFNFMWPPLIPGGSLPFSFRSPPKPHDCCSPGTQLSCNKIVENRLDQQKYSCSDCSKLYSTFSGLSKHRQFHCMSILGTKSFDCKQCDKTYSTLGALKMHVRTHTLPCKCHICGKAFSRPWLLQGHIRTHTGEKPFQCSECERCFADRSNLRAHLQTHAHVKKYACDNCQKTFSRMSLLTKHLEAACPVLRKSTNEPYKNCRAES